MMSINETVDEEQTIDVDLDDSQESEDQESEVNEVESETDETEETEDEELVVSFGEDSPPQQDEESDFEGKPAPQWVKDLRKSERELKRKLKEMEQKQAQVNIQPSEDVIHLGKEPDLSDDDIAYDADVFKQKWNEWNERKLKVAEQQAKQQAAQQQKEQELKAVIDSYNEKKSKLNVKDFDDSEYEVADKLTPEQQGLILEGANDSALLIYALGKNKARLEELAAIKNPVKFAFAVAKLEAVMKQNTRKVAVSPERKVNGQSGTAANKSKLAELEAEAARTGDRTKLIQYRKSLNK